MSFITHWVSSIFGGLSGALHTLENKVKHALVALWGLLLAIFLPVKRAWSAMTRAATVVGRLLEDIPRDLYIFGRWLVRQAIPAVVRWARVEFARVAHDLAAAARSIVRWARSEFAKVASELAAGLRAIEKWAVHEIGVYALGAWHWVTKYGALVVGWIEHPETLAKFLLGPLWSVFLATVTGSEKIIAQWLVASLLAAMVKVSDVIEAILADIV